MKLNKLSQLIPTSLQLDSANAPTPACLLTTVLQTLSYLFVFYKTKKPPVRGQLYDTGLFKTIKRS